MFYSLLIFKTQFNDKNSYCFLYRKNTMLNLLTQYRTKQNIKFRYNTDIVTIKR